MSKQDAYRRLSEAAGRGEMRVEGDSVRLTANQSKQSFDGLGLEAARMSHFVGDRRVTTEKNPYASIIIKSSDPTDVGMVLGQFEATWDRIRSAKDDGVKWFVEVQVMLSRALRNRVVGVSLFCPEVANVDLSVRSMAQHFENMEERRAKQYSRLVASWQHFLEEEPARFDDRHIRKSHKDKNITLDGLVRLLRDIRTFANDEFCVNGPVVYRVGLEKACGIVMRGEHLDQENPVVLLKAWLSDMVEFTTGPEGRQRVWNGRLRRFDYVGLNALGKRDGQSMDSILQTLGRDE